MPAIPEEDRKRSPASRTGPRTASPESEYEDEEEDGEDEESSPEKRKRSQRGADSPQEENAGDDESQEAKRRGGRQNETGTPSEGGNRSEGGKQGDRGKGGTRSEASGTGRGRRQGEGGRSVRGADGEEEDASGEDDEEEDDGEEDDEMSVASILDAYRKTKDEKEAAGDQAASEALEPGTEAGDAAQQTAAAPPHGEEEERGETLGPDGKPLKLQQPKAPLRMEMRNDGRQPRTRGRQKGPQKGAQKTQQPSSSQSVQQSSEQQGADVQSERGQEQRPEDGTANEQQEEQEEDLILRSKEKGRGRNQRTIARNKKSPRSEKPDERPQERPRPGQKQQRTKKPADVRKPEAPYDASREFGVNRGRPLRPAENDSLDDLFLKNTSTAQRLVSLEDDLDDDRRLFKARGDDTRPTAVGGKVHLFKKTGDFVSLRYTNRPAKFGPAHGKMEDLEAMGAEAGGALLRPRSASNLLDRVPKEKETIYTWGKRIPMDLVMGIHLQHYCPPLWDSRTGKVRRGSF